AMAQRFERAVVLQQPVAVISAIDRDFIKLFALTRSTSPGDTPISRWQFQATYPTYPTLITLHYVASIRPGPLLAVAALAGLAGSCVLGGGRRGRTAAASACVLFTSVAVLVLLGSD